MTLSAPVFGAPARTRPLSGTFHAFAMYALFALVVLANVSKWYLDFDLRIAYYVPVGIGWLLLVLAAGDALAIPRGSIAGLIVLKVGFVLYLVAHFAILAPLGALASPGLSAKGLAIELLNAVLVVTGVMFVTRLGPRMLERVLGYCLGAAVFAASYSAGEALGIYAFGIDLDRLVTAILPAWNGPAPSVTEDVFGLAALGGRPLYRLSGLSGDPNVNGTILVLGLPILFHQGIRRPLFTAFLGTLLLAVIVMTVSNTAIPLALLVILFLGFFLRGRAGWLPKFAIAAGVSVAIAAAVLAGPALLEVAEFKLAAGGTSSVHFRIALDALAVWRDNPQGIGLNNFSVVSRHISTHNTYVRLLAELGVVGLGLSLAWVLYCLAACLRLRTRLGYSVALCVAVCSLAAMGHDILYRFEFQFTLHILVAVAIADARSANLARRQAAARTVPAAAQPAPSL